MQVDTPDQAGNWGYIALLSMIQTEDAVRIWRAFPKPDEASSAWNSGNVRSRPPWSTII